MKKLLLLLLMSFTVLNADNAKGAVLDAKIEILPAHPVNANPKVIQPGTPITIAAKIKNSGTESNEKGFFFVRFVYPTPLASKPESQLFSTEKITLPSIAPGREATIVFNTVQPTPAVFDFIRQDYGMRQYQAVVVIDSKEYIIGDATLTFSAYYYPGAAHEMETEVPASTKPANVLPLPGMQPVLTQ